MPPRSPSHAFDPTPALEHDPDNFSPLNREVAMDNQRYAGDGAVRAVHFSDHSVSIGARHSIATATVPLMSSVPSAYGRHKQNFVTTTSSLGISMTEYIDKCRSLNEQLRQAHETERKAWNIERSALQARIADLEFRLNKGRDSNRRSSNDSSAASAQSFRADFRTMYNMGRPGLARSAASLDSNHGSVPPVWKGPEATPPVTRIFSHDDSDVNHLAPISEDVESFPPLTQEISPHTKVDGPPIDVSVVDSTLEGITLKSSGPAVTSSFVSKITSPQFNSSSGSPSPPPANRPPSNTLLNPPNNLSFDPNTLLDPLDKKLRLHAGHTPLAVEDGALPLSEIPTELHTPKQEPEEVPVRVESEPITKRPRLRPSEKSDSYFSFVDVASETTTEKAAQGVPAVEEIGLEPEQPPDPEPSLEAENDPPLKGPLMLDPSARSPAASVFLEQVDAKLSQVAAESSRLRSDSVGTAEHGGEGGPAPLDGQKDDPATKEKEDKSEFGHEEEGAHETGVPETSIDGLPKLKIKMSTNFGSAWGGDMPGKI